MLGDKSVSLMRDTAWSALAAVVMSAGRLVLAAVLARKLGTAHFGEFVFTQWLIDIVFILGSFGQTGAGSRFFAQYRFESVEVYKAFGRWYAFRAVQVVAFSACLTPLVAYLFRESADVPYLGAVSIWAIGNGAWAVTMARLQGLQRFKLVAVSNFLYVTVACVGAIILPAEWGINGTIAVLAAATFAGALACAFAKSQPSPTHEAEGQMFSSSVVSTYANNVWMSSAIGALVWSRAEISVVRAMLGPVDVAFYGAALTIAGLANVGMALLTGALGPRLAQLWGQRKKEEAWNLSRTVTDYLVLVSGIGIAFIITFSNEILLFVFGSEYRAAGSPLVLLALGAFGLCSGCANTLVQYQTNGAFARNVNLVGAFLLFALAVPLVNALGVSGAALARSGVQLAVAAATFHYCAKELSPTAFSWRNVAWTSFLLSALLLVSLFQISDCVAPRFLIYVAFVAALGFVLKVGPENLGISEWARKKLRPRFVGGIDS